MKQLSLSFNKIYVEYMSISTSTRGKTFRDEVYDIVANIKKGHVLTYGEVARRAGRPGAARAVGTVMKENPDTKRVPCHRVVRADGSIGEYAFGGTRAKLKKLREEGVKFLSATRVKI